MSERPIPITDPLDEFDDIDIAMPTLQPRARGLTKPHTVILPKPAPCRESYWVGASRDELRQRVAEQRPRQWRPTLADVKFDPMLDATASLMAHKEWAKARRECGR